MAKKWRYTGSLPVDFPPNICVERGQYLPEYASEEKIAELLAKGLIVEEGAAEAPAKVEKKSDAFSVKKKTEGEFESGS